MFNFDLNSFDKNIAFDLLKLEKNIFEEYNSEAEKNLELIFKTVKDQIAKKNYFENLTDREAVHKVLWESLRIIFSLGYSYEDNISLFNNRLITKKMNCRDLAILYVSIFQVLGFNLEEVSLVLCPRHVFVRFRFLDGSKFNWEPTGNLSSTDKNVLLEDSWYISHFQVFPQSIEKGVYMKSLLKKDITGLFYQGVGTYIILTSKNFEKAIELLKKSLEYNNFLYESYYYLALAMFDSGEITFETKQYLERAINLNPSAVRAKKLLTSVNIKLKFNP